MIWCVCVCARKRIFVCDWLLVFSRFNFCTLLSKSKHTERSKIHYWEWKMLWRGKQTNWNQTKRVMHTYSCMHHTHTHTPLSFKFVSIPVAFVLHSLLLFSFSLNDLLAVIVYRWLCKAIYDLVVNSQKSAFSVSHRILIANAVLSHKAVIM